MGNEAQPREYVDVFDYLLDKAGSPAYKPDEKPSEELLQFVERARTVLRGNQPVSTDFGNGVLTLRLQDMTLVPMICDAERTTGGDEGYVPVTQPKQNDPKTRGMQPNMSFGITGRKK